MSTTLSEEVQRPFQLQQFEPYIDVDAVAKHLSIERRQVLALTRKGFLPGRPLNPAAGRKQWRYRLSEVDAVMQGRKASRTADERYNLDRQPRNRKAS
jgi:hypothetical protein